MGSFKISHLLSTSRFSSLPASTEGYNIPLDTYQLSPPSHLGTSASDNTLIPLFTFFNITFVTYRHDVCEGEGVGLRLEAMVGF